MVELRKRKTPPPAPVRPAKTSKKAAPEKKAPAEKKTAVGKAKAAVADAVAAVTETVTEAVTEAVNGATSGTPKVGDTIDLATFGGEIETHEGVKTTLQKLVEESKGGVVLFTYPKASTPGCKKPQFSTRATTLNMRAKTISSN
jgi:peroxiredoxin Q/BCP